MAELVVGGTGAVVLGLIGFARVLCLLARVLITPSGGLISVPPSTTRRAFTTTRSVVASDGALGARGGPGFA